MQQARLVFFLGGGGFVRRCSSTTEVCQIKLMVGVVLKWACGEWWDVNCEQMKLMGIIRYVIPESSEIVSVGRNPRGAEGPHPFGMKAP